MPLSLPSGSFIAKPVTTPVALAAQAERNGVVRERYRSALGLSTVESVAPTLRTLHLTTLSQPGMYRVYYARPEGAWGYKIRRVPPGTAVFSDGENKPVALQICGNPVRALQSAKSSPLHQAKDWSPTESDAGLIVEDSPLTDELASAFAPPAPASFVDSTPLVDSGAFDSVGTFAGGTATAATATTAAASTAAGGFSYGGLAAPLLGALTVSNGSNSASLSPSVVPEPGWNVFGPTMIAAMGLCLGWNRLRTTGKKRATTTFQSTQSRQSGKNRV